MSELRSAVNENDSRKKKFVSMNVLYIAFSSIDFCNQFASIYTCLTFRMSSSCDIDSRSSPVTLPIMLPICNIED